MSDVNKRYFESLMQGKSLSLRGLAQRMNMSHSQLSLTFSGDRKMQLDEAAQIASIFGEPLYRVIENVGVQVRGTATRRVSVVGAVQGDGTVLIHPAGTIERTNAPEDVPENGIAIQCRTAGSPLDWLDGAVFFCPAADGISNTILGRFTYCQVKGGPAVVAAVKRGYRENTFNLSGPFAAESVALEWATPILWTRN